MVQKARTRAAALDGAGGQRFLDEPLAARTGQPRPHDPVYDEATRDEFQLLGHILADLAQAGAFSPATPGTARPFPEAQESYARAVVDFVDVAALRPMTILVNAGNGTAGPTFDAIAAELDR